jgi:protein-L-isoaspartate(D-aspartate) O-methyltransferase
MTGYSVEQARFNMIEQQIRPWEVLDEQVLDIMTVIPREAYVPAAYVGLAYADIEVPIGVGQTMMAPRLVARMLQALRLQPDDKVLEIGTGTGYVTACLAALGKSLVSIELIPELQQQARENLARQQVEDVQLHTADAMAESIADAPFDAIAVTGSLPSEQRLPPLQAQLTIGGRLFIVIGEAPLMRAILITRTAERDFRREILFETKLPALSHVPAAEHFTF